MIDIVSGVKSESEPVSLPIYAHSYFRETRKYVLKLFKSVICLLITKVTVAFVIILLVFGVSLNGSKVFQSKECLLIKAELELLDPETGSIFKEFGRESNNTILSAFVHDLEKFHKLQHEWNHRMILEPNYESSYLTLNHKLEALTNSLNAKIFPCSSKLDMINEQVASKLAHDWREISPAILKDIHLSRNFAERLVKGTLNLRDLSDDRSNKLDKIDEGLALVSDVVDEIIDEIF